MVSSILTQRNKQWLSILGLGTIAILSCAGFEGASYRGAAIIGIIVLLASAIIHSSNTWMMTLFMLPFLYTQLTALVGCVFLEESQYIYELLTDSFQTGATLRLALLTAVMVVGFQTGWRVTESRAGSVGVREGRARVSGWWLILPCIYVLVSVYEIGRYGTAIGMQTNRFEYRAIKETLDITRLLVTWPLMFMLLAYIAAKRWDDQRIRWLCVALMVAGLMRTVLVGNKFSGIVSLAILSGVVWEAIAYTRGRTRARLLVYSIACVSLFVVCAALIAFHYSSIQGYYGSRHDLTEQVVNRFNAQGAVWWVTDYEVSGNGQRLGMPVVLRHVAQPWVESGELVGLQLMSSFVTTRDLSGQFALGSALTMAYPAISILLLGWGWGTVAVFVVGVGCGCVSWFTHRAARMNSPVLLLLWGRIYMVLWMTCSTADIQDLFGVKFLANVAMAIGVYGMVGRWGRAARERMDRPIVNAGVGELRSSS
jgi:hypothetical protein